MSYGLSYVFETRHGLANCICFNQLEDYYYSFNVRGFRITGDITSKVSFETRFYESQFFYPDYLRERAKNRGTTDNTIDAIAFGVGRAKNFKNNAMTDNPFIFLDSNTKKYKTCTAGFQPAQFSVVLASCQHHTSERVFIVAY